MNNYPLLDLFWTMLWFFVFVVWLLLLFRIVSDIFASRDLSGWAKALWTLVLIVLPVLGSLIYLIARGTGMEERALQRSEAAEASFRQYVQQTAASGPAADPSEQLARMASLHEQGVLTDEEFAAQKRKLLA
jgi:hypothetical protein